MGASESDSTNSLEIDCLEVFNMRRLVTIRLAFAAAAMPVLAVDGVVGRTITGTRVIPESVSSDRRPAPV
jgi:hypothetical protein